MPEGPTPRALVAGPGIGSPFIRELPDLDMTVSGRRMMPLRGKSVGYVASIVISLGWMVRAEPGLRNGMNDSQLISTRTPESRALFDRVKVATRLSAKLSGYCLDEGESIQRVFEELIGKPVGESFTLIPPFYTDYGLNITVGRAVFIGYECAFTGHGAIDIADEVMSAHKVNLVTAGHPVEPDKRRAYITAEPITIDRNVWIGAAATILPGVTAEADSVVAAGAVVTHDVPPATLVAGVPARVIRHL